MLPPDWLVGSAVLALLGGLYVAPLTVGALRDVEQLRRCVLLNLGWGWTVLGWWGALRLALRPVRPAIASGRDDRAWAAVASATAPLRGTW